MCIRDSASYQNKITTVAVTINNVSHALPDDVKILTAKIKSKRTCFYVSKDVGETCFTIYSDSHSVNERFVFTCFHKIDMKVFKSQVFAKFLIFRILVVNRPTLIQRLLKYCPYCVKHKTISLIYQLMTKIIVGTIYNVYRKTES